jgi:hypothetical protein
MTKSAAPASAMAMVVATAIIACRSSFVGPTGLSPSTGGFVYRGHTAAVTWAKFLPSGTYVVSGDTRDRLRVWAYNHNEHLPRLDVQVLAGPVRDLCWYREGVRVAVSGDGGAQSAESYRIVMWDMGVKYGDLQVHGRRRGLTCAIRPCRPARSTGGVEDAALYFHSGPPFKRVTGGGRRRRPRQEVPRGGGGAPPAAQRGRLVQGRERAWQFKGVLLLVELLRLALAHVRGGQVRTIARRRDRARVGQVRPSSSKTSPSPLPFDAPPTTRPPPSVVALLPPLPPP